MTLSGGVDKSSASDTLLAAGAGEEQGKGLGAKSVIISKTIRMSSRYLKLALAATIPALSILSSATCRADVGRFSVVAELSDSSVTALDTLTLVLELSWDSRFVTPGSLVAPSLSLSRMRVGSVSSSESSTAGSQSGMKERKYAYQLIPERSGVGRVAPLEIVFLNLADSTQQKAVTDELTLKITAPLRDERSGMNQWTLFLLGILVAAGVGALVWRKGRSKNVVGADPVQEELQTRLAKLKTLTATSKAEFYSEGYQLLRWMTGQVESGSESCEKLVRWLSEAEREKFAPGNGDPGELLRRYVEIERFAQEELNSESAKVETDKDEQTYQAR